MDAQVVFQLGCISLCNAAVQRLYSAACPDVSESLRPNRWGSPPHHVTGAQAPNLGASLELRESFTVAKARFLQVPLVLQDSETGGVSPLALPHDGWTWCGRRDGTGQRLGSQPNVHGDGSFETWGGLNWEASGCAGFHQSIGGAIIA